MGIILSSEGLRRSPKNGQGRFHRCHVAWPPRLPSQSLRPLWQRNRDVVFGNQSEIPYPSRFCSGHTDPTTYKVPLSRVVRFPYEIFGSLHFGKSLMILYWCRNFAINYNDRRNRDRGRENECLRCNRFLSQPSSGDGSLLS